MNSNYLSNKVRQTLLRQGLIR